MPETSRETSPIPTPVRAASEWAWRLLIIVVAVVAAAYALGHLSEVVVPVIISTLLTALLGGIHQWLSRHMSRGLAAGVTLLGTIVVIAGLLTLAGTQISGGMSDMATQAGAGISQIRDWLRTTFNITDTQFNGYIDQLTQALQSNTDLRSAAARAGVTATHVVAGLFISLFGLFFFLYDGPGIWGWIVRLFPRTARSRVESSGQVAWSQLSAYTHATVLVAAVDAVGITVGALILRVPFALAIGVLVFVLSFIPIVGALLSGAVAVLLALVAHGPVNALIMLGVVVVVQQVESHVLQPFVLGRSVKIHPLAVILSIATGAVLAGIVGTLIAVPTVAVVSSVWRHLVSGDAATEAGDPLPTDEVAGSAGSVEAAPV